MTFIHLNVKFKKTGSNVNIPVFHYNFQENSFNENLIFHFRKINNKKKTKTRQSITTFLFYILSGPGCCELLYWSIAIFIYKTAHKLSAQFLNIFFHIRTVAFIEVFSTFCKHYLKNVERKKTFKGHFSLP